MQSITFIHNWQATILSASGYLVSVSSSDVTALAAKAPDTSLDGTSEATTYFSIPVSLFDAAGDYLGMAHITGFGVAAGYAATEIKLSTNGYATALAAGGVIACRIAPKWLEHDAQHRLHRSHTLASGTLTLDKGALNGSIDVTGTSTIELPHSYSMNAQTGDYTPRKIECVIWLYDSGATQPSVTIAGQNIFYVQDNIRWADGSAPAFSSGYKLLQLRLTLMGSGHTWCGTWTKHSDY